VDQNAAVKETRSGKKQNGIRKADLLHFAT
jgi:hypothetical protein